MTRAKWLDTVDCLGAGDPLAEMAVLIIWSPSRRLVAQFCLRESVISNE